MCIILSQEYIYIYILEKNDIKLKLLMLIIKF